MYSAIKRRINMRIMFWRKPRVNLKLLDFVLKQIDQHPFNWDQDYWGKAYHSGTFAQELHMNEGIVSKSQMTLDINCGTVFCLAGWVAVLSDEVDLVWQKSLIAWSAKGVSWSAKGVRNRETGTIYKISSYAQDQLNLTDED